MILFKKKKMSKKERNNLRQGFCECINIISKYQFKTD